MSEVGSSKKPGKGKMGGKGGRGGVKSTTKSVKAGLTFPVGRFARHLKKGSVFCILIFSIEKIFIQISNRRYQYPFSTFIDNYIFEIFLFT